MFGDFGHGCILILFSGWMILTEKKHMGIPSPNEIWNIMFGGKIFSNVVHVKDVKLLVV